MRNHPCPLPATVRPLVLGVLALLCLAVWPHRVEGQLDRLRRVRERVPATPSLKSLFGEEPPLTTTLADAKDGVPALDGFEPEVFSPMAEMPRGPGGYFLLSPGAYTFEAQSFCLWPGTYGPGEGNGYLHAYLEGPKAELITSILGRASDQPEIEQRDVQELLWAVLSRAKPSGMRQGTRLTAARLLLPRELAEMEGYALNTVPEALGRRVLENTPTPLRRALEAENEMRRLMGSAGTRFEELERVAVLTGAVPPGEEGEPLPEGRWSFHPNGFFIRFKPRHYTVTRIQVYYPATVEIERDARGRITSVETPDGSWVGAEYEAAPTLAFARAGGDPMDQRLRAIRFTRPSDPNGSSASEWRPGAEAQLPAPRWMTAIRRAGGWDSIDPIELARADLEDLALLGAVVEREIGPGAGAEASATLALLRSALHSALARYYRVLEPGTVPVPGGAVLSPRLARTGSGFRYAIRSSATAGAEFQHPGRMMPLQPGRSGILPPGPRQRLGSSTRPAGDDVLDKSRKMVGALSNANDLMGLFTDPAGLFGGGIPSALFGAALDWNFDNARKIGDAMQGGTGGDNSPVPAPRPQQPDPTWEESWGAFGVPYAQPASLSPSGGPGARTRPADHGRQDYRTVARPRTIDLPRTPVSGEVSPEHAAAVDAVLEETFRMGALLEAAETAQRRYAQAAELRDAEAEYLQGEALVYLKREAGVAMESLAGKLEALRSVAGSSGQAMANEAGVREAQLRLGADGMPAEAVEMARAVGLSEGWARTRQTRLATLSPGEVADRAPAALQSLIDELRSYGSYLATLPHLPRPWAETGAPAQG